MNDPQQQLLMPLLEEIASTAWDLHRWKPNNAKDEMHYQKRMRDLLGRVSLAQEMHDLIFKGSTVSLHEKMLAEIKAASIENVDSKSIKSLLQQSVHAAGVALDRAPTEDDHDRARAISRHEAILDLQTRVNLVVRLHHYVLFGD